MPKWEIHLASCGVRWRKGRRSRRSATGRTPIRESPPRGDAYSRCIAEKGYRGSTGEDLSSRFFEDTVPYRTAYESHVATLVQAGKDSSGVRLDSVLTGEQRVRLRQIQQAEIKAAVADWECGKVLYPVVTEVHQEYMDRYLAGEK